MAPRSRDAGVGGLVPAWTRTTFGGRLPELPARQTLAALMRALNGRDRWPLASSRRSSHHPPRRARAVSGRCYVALDAGPARSREWSRPDTHWRHLRGAVDALRLVPTARLHREWLEHVDPTMLSDVELWSSLERWEHEAAPYLRVLLLADARHEVAVAAVAVRRVSGVIRPALAALGAAARSDQAVVQHLWHGPRDIRALRYELRGSTFLAAVDRYLQARDHHGPFEYDWSEPRYREAPARLFDAIRAMLPAAEGGTEATATREPGPPAAPPARLRAEVSGVIGALRPWHLALAERFVQRGWLDVRDHYFVLQGREIAPVVNGECSAAGLRGLVAQRHRTRQRQLALAAPDVLGDVSATWVGAGQAVAAHQTRRRVHNGPPS